MEHKLTITKVKQIYREICNYGIVTLLIISSNKHDQHCYIIVPMQHAIRLFNFMWENISLVNPVHLVKFVKDFARALGHYGLITLKELYVCHSPYFQLSSWIWNRSIYNCTIPLHKAVEYQGRGITSRHHIPCGGEGLAVRIKNTSDEGDDVSGKMIWI